MEKTGEIRPGATPDTEHKLPKAGEKQAADPQTQAATLDDDFTKRAADVATDRLKTK
jgi:hypothetical protein